jgi:hypothetical protein
MDYRHGRGLFISTRDGGLGRKELLIWDSITGVQRRFPVAPQASESTYPGAAVVCAVPGCNHHPVCNGGDFKVALLFADPPFVDYFEDDPDIAEMKCFVYSSQTDTWIQESSLHGISEDLGSRPSVLAGQCLYFLSDGLVIFELDLSAHTLSQIDLPEMDEKPMDNDDSLILMITEDGGLGLIEANEGNIFIWSRDVSAHGNATWSMTETFDHYNLFGKIGIEEHSLLGFAEGTRVFFVGTPQGNFAFELPHSMVPMKDLELVKRLLVEQNFTCVRPVVSFYTPFNGLQQNEVEQQSNQPNPNEDDGEESSN